MYHSHPPPPPSFFPLACSCSMTGVTHPDGWTNLVLEVAEVRVRFYAGEPSRSCFVRVWEEGLEFGLASLDPSLGSGGSDDGVGRGGGGGGGGSSSSSLSSSGGSSSGHVDRPRAALVRLWLALKAGGGGGINARLPVLFFVSVVVHRSTLLAPHHLFSRLLCSSAQL